MAVLAAVLRVRVRGAGAASVSAADDEARLLLVLVFLVFFFVLVVLSDLRDGGRLVNLDLGKHVFRRVEFD